MMNIAWQERLRNAIFHNLNEGKVTVTEKYNEYTFRTDFIGDIEFWSIKWNVFRHSDYVPFNEIHVNSQSRFVEASIARQIAVASAEYAVMDKLG